jgi:hypothetical protein
MATSHRTNRLKLIGTPAVEQLQNGRYQLTVNCTTMNSREDWYSSNRARIFPDFGSLESAEMSIDGLAPRTGEAYADMRLVSVQSSTQQEKYIVTLVYQTLGATFVQVKDDTVNYIENGLRRVTRTSIAKAGTDFQKTVGTSFINSQIGGETSIICKLASYEIDDTDSYREVTEIYVQPGIISNVVDFEGSQNTFVQETFSQEPFAPSGFSKARTEISNTGGIPTKRFTFLKDDVILSETEDKVSSQKAIVEEWFNPSLIQDPAGDPPTFDRRIKADYSLARKESSNVNGITTQRFTFLKNDVKLSDSTDNVGSQKAIVEEWFNPSLVEAPDADPPTVDRRIKVDPDGLPYALARTDISNVDGIPTQRFTFLKENVKLVTSIENKRGLGGVSGEGEPPSFALIRETIQVFKPALDADGKVAKPTPDTTGAVLIGEDSSDVEGIQTTRFTFAKGEGEIIVDKRPAISQLGGCTQFTVTTLGSTVPADPTGTIIGRTESESDGYKTFVVTAIQGQITGVKQLYRDVVQVEVPGTVDCSTINVSSGPSDSPVTGTLAVPKVTPRRRKTISATVTVEITTAPPNTANAAFDLGSISCSVTSTNVSLVRGAGNTVSVTSGSSTSTQTGFSQSFSASSRIQTYPGCFLNTTSSNGAIEYTASETPRASGNTIVTDTVNSNRNTICEGTGSTSATGYSASGIIKRNSRPILTDLEGVTYYEVITWSV